MTSTLRSYSSYTAESTVIGATVGTGETIATQKTTGSIGSTSTGGVQGTSQSTSSKNNETTATSSAIETSAGRRTTIGNEPNSTVTHLSVATTGLDQTIISTTSASSTVSEYSTSAGFSQLFTTVTSTTTQEGSGTSAHVTASTILTTGNISGQPPTTGAGGFVAYTSVETTEVETASTRRINIISATSDQTPGSSESTANALITTASGGTETLTDATLTTTAETSRLVTNQTAPITEATSKVSSTTHSADSTTETPYVERNASTSPTAYPTSAYVSTASSVDVTDVASTTRPDGNTGKILGLQPVYFGLIVGGAVILILVLLVALILCTKRRKKKRRLRKSSSADAWISRPGSSGVALTNLTFNPPLDLETGNVDGDISTLDGLATAPMVNIFATDNEAFEADTSPSQTQANRRATLNARKESESVRTQEKKVKGLTPAKIPVVSPSKSPSIDGASLNSEPRSPTSFGSPRNEIDGRQKSFLYQPSNSAADSTTTANTYTPSAPSDGNARVAPPPPDASSTPPGPPAPPAPPAPAAPPAPPAPPTPPAFPAPPALATPNQTTVSSLPPPPAAPPLPI